MLTTRLIIILPLLLATATGTKAQDSLLLRDYRFVRRSDAWLTAANGAALTRFGADNIAEANLSLNRAKGGLTDFSDAPSVLQATAAVESFMRLNSRTVVFGAMSYDNHSGDDMAASAFLPVPAASPAGPQALSSYAAMSSQPQLQPHLPFDIIEDSLNNLGRKHRDVYRLAGAVGHSLSRNLAIGLRAEYTAANYAKYKDLRHQNNLMDMRLTAGIYAPLASWLQVGMHYQYHRNTESLTFSTYGKSDRVYQSLISYAAFMGPLEQFGTNGYTDRSRAMPLVSDYHGLGVQVGIGNDAPLAFYNAFDYAHRHGYYGRRSPYTITYANHRSDIYTYDARLSINREKTQCHVDFNLNAENLENDGANYRELINDAGASYYDYLTPTKTANRLWVDLRTTLTFDIGITGETPTWSFQTGHHRLHRKQTAYLYPYYRRQKIDSDDFWVAATRNVLCHSGVWSVSLSGAFRHGGGEPYEDLTFAAPSDKQSAPATMEAYLWREYRWLTAAQYEVGAALRYAFILPGTRMKLHAEAAASHRKANENFELCLGRDRTTATMSIGATF